MEAQKVERELAAIFAADVEGNSRLMGLDEIGAHGLPGRHRSPDRLSSRSDFNTVDLHIESFMRCDIFDPSEIWLVKAAQWLCDNKEGAANEFKEIVFGSLGKDVPRRLPTGGLPRSIISKRGPGISGAATHAPLPLTLLGG